MKAWWIRTPGGHGVLLPSRRMLGPRVVGLALVLVGTVLIGCNDKPTGGATLDSPDAAAAGSEARAQRARSDRTSLTGGATPVRSLVAVASTSAKEAEPCERTCGRVGDCLLDGDEVNAFEAGRLELQCLEMCVHTPESQVRSAFLGCEAKSACSELLGCARSKWEPLAATHQGLAVQGFTARAADPCTDGCRWMYYCSQTGAPPGQATLSPEYEQQMRACEAACEAGGPYDRELWIRFVECAPTKCSPMEIINCFY